jgi:hypothetical protein
MAHRIVLEKDFEFDKAGAVITVTNAKMKRILAAKVPFKRRLISGTGVREYEYQKPEKPVKEEEE